MKYVTHLVLATLVLTLVGCKPLIDQGHRDHNVNKEHQGIK